MTATFLILAAITIAGTVAAMALRNLVHCVLALTVGFAGLAALYLQLGAQFVGFTQILVYVGAVAILVGLRHYDDAAAHANFGVDLFFLLVWRESDRRAGVCRSWLGDSFKQPRHQASRCRTRRLPSSTSATR